MTGHEAFDDSSREAGRPGSRWLLAILGLAFALRVWKLGSLSFWYDEVVTLRLARSPGPSALIELLGQIDATRAPLHPLLLQLWIRLFGPSEASARLLSVLFGVATVALVCWIGRMVFDPPTGLWAAWLAAVSPLLVYYSREARMYAPLVTLTCVAWGLLFSLRGAGPGQIASRMAGYALSLAALLYVHPLGLLMMAALASGSLIGWRAYFGTRGRWLAVHALAFILAAPWIGRYFDHAPEFLSGRLPLKFLLGTPIGFLGGNALVLMALLVLIIAGLVRRRRAGQPVPPDDLACLLVWLCGPPILLYAYSLIGSPVFGPARYTLFVAPAYLILVAQGLARMPLIGRGLTTVAILILAGQSLRSMVYAPDLKADWRGLAQVIAARMREDPTVRITVLVPPPGPGSNRNVEVETARYYLPEECRVLDATNPLAAIGRSAPDEENYLAISFKGPAANSPEGWTGNWTLDRSFPGLTVYRSVVP